MPPGNKKGRVEKNNEVEILHIPKPTQKKTQVPKKAPAKPSKKSK